MIFKNKSKIFKNFWDGKFYKGGVGKELIFIVEVF